MKKKKRMKYQKVFIDTKMNQEKQLKTKRKVKCEKKGKKR